MLVVQSKKQISEIKKKVNNHNYDKDITTTAEIFAARLVQANLITKTDFDTKPINLNKKIHSNKTKYLLVKNQLKQLQNI